MESNRFFEKMKITITGASGFVGVNVKKYLESKYEINCLSLRTSSKQKLDLQTGVVIHLAGKAHDLKNTSSREEYFQVNYELTKELYNEFLKSDAKKFVFVSSVKASADSVTDILTEDQQPNPKTDYGKSKLMAEQYIQNQELPEGKSYFILRPCMIHGPGNKGNLNLLYKFVQKGIPYPLAAFENQRSFLSVGNLCFVIKQLLENEIPSGIYNVADDEALSTSKVVEIFAQSLNKKAKLWRVPPKLIKGMAKIGDLLSLPLNSERLQKLTESYVVSNAKIKATLRESLPLGTTEGLQVTAKSFQDPNLPQL